MRAAGGMDVVVAGIPAMCRRINPPTKPELESGTG
jgi:hypothetical protein